jgi:hypothetical protein
MAGQESPPEPGPMAESSGSIYYRKGAFRDVLGLFGGSAGSVKTPSFSGFSRIFREIRRIGIQIFETGPIGHSGTSPNRQRPFDRGVYVFFGNWLSLHFLLLYHSVYDRIEKLPPGEV